MGRRKARRNRASQERIDRRRAQRRVGSGRRCRVTGKVPYLSRTAAEAAAQIIAERLGELRAYRDQRCGHWHLTSNV